MGKVNQVTDADFNKEVLQSQIPVVVDFWAPWCGPCKMMAPSFEAAAEKLGDKIKFLKMNTDENQSSPTQYQISGIPCLIVFKDGKEVDRIVGMVPAAALEEKLKAYA
ncbi:MAG: thioredoxin [Candidatus Saganbacteria bacterium]|nr:thioredoxin [Candidatus Saganbacteria bacterium]